MHVRMYICNLYRHKEVTKILLSLTDSFASAVGEAVSAAASTVVASTVVASTIGIPVASESFIVVQTGCLMTFMIRKSLHYSPLLDRHPLSTRQPQLT